MAEQMLYTVAEVAEILRCNQNAVHRIRNAGLLPFIRLGRLKCRREALEDFLKKYEGYDVTDPTDIRPLPVDETMEAEEG